MVSRANSLISDEHPDANNINHCSVEQLLSLTFDVNFVEESNYN